VVMTDAKQGKMNRTHLVISIVVIGTFLIALKLSPVKNILILLGYLPRDFHPVAVYLTHYLNWLIPLVLALLALNKFNLKSLPAELGLSSGFTTGVGFAFLVTLPMLLGYAFVSRINQDLSFFFILKGAVLPGFMEELLFRGFLFGLLFRRAGWGFIPAVAVNALFFSAAHLYQSADLIVSLSIFLVTFAGAAWFAWLYMEWENSLWLPIFLHIFMNLWWNVFQVADNAAGGIMANVFRAFTIAITIFVTVRRRKKIGYFRVTKKNLILKTS